MPNEQESFDIREQVRHYLRLIRERWYGITVMTVVALLIGVGLAQLWPATYEARTVFSLRESQFIDESTLEKSVEKVKLAAKKNTFQREIRSVSRIREVLKALEWKEYIKAQGDGTGRSLMELFQKVGDALSVEVLSEGVGETIVTLTFEWTDPYKAAAFVNTMRDLWIDLKIKNCQKDCRDRLNQAEKVVADRRRAYEEAVQERDRFDDEHNIAALGAVEENQRQIDLLRKDLIDSEVKEKSLGKRIEELQAELLEIPATLQHEQKKLNQEYVKAETAYKKVLMTIRQRQQSWTEAHPEMQKLYDKLKAAKEQLDELEGQQFIVEGLLEIPNEQYVLKSNQMDLHKSEYDLAKEAMDRYQRELEQVEGNQRLLPSILAERRELEADIELKRTLYQEAEQETKPIQDRVNSFLTFQQKEGTWEPESTFRDQASEVLTAASPQGEPKNPMTIIILSLSLFLGFGLGLVLSLIGELLKSSYTTQEEVASHLKRPVLGSVSPIMTESEISAIKWRKVIFATSTLLLIFSLVAILYICNQYPQLIPHAIVEKVNEIREALG